MAKSGPVDEHGVSALMRQFIDGLITTHSWREACDFIQSNERTPKRWYKNNPGFKALFDETFGGSVDIELWKKDAEILQGKAMRVYDETMESFRTVEAKVQCPECGTRFTHELVLPNTNARLRAADSITKMTGLLKETKEVKGKVTHFHQLDGATKAAFFSLRAGVTPSPAMLERLRAAGLLDEGDQPLALSQGNVVEGEYTEVEG